MLRDLILRNNVMIAQGGVDWQADTAQLLGNVPDRVQGLFFGKYVFICMREVVSIGIDVLIRQLYQDRKVTLSKSKI